MYVTSEYGKRISAAAVTKRLKDRAISQADIRRIPTAAALRQVFAEYFGFPCQVLFHAILHTHLSLGADTIGQLVADVPNGLSHPAPRN
jgi:hypothetical protein